MISAYHTSTHIKCPNAKLSTMLRVIFNALSNKREESSKQLDTVVPFCTISLWQSSKITGAQINLVNECTASTHSCKIRSNWGLPRYTFTPKLLHKGIYTTLQMLPFYTLLTPKIIPHRGVNTTTGATTLGTPATS